jgi:hypothetical protein
MKEGEFNGRIKIVLVAETKRKRSPHFIIKESKQRRKKLCRATCG